MVISAGTGGTITGIARVIKRELSGVEIIGVDPVGSILAGPAEVKSYKVEGIGYDFIPDVLESELVDRWIKTNDRDSFRVARRLIRHEGLLVGGSSGAAVWAAMQVCQEMKAGQRVVAVLADSIRCSASLQQMTARINVPSAIRGSLKSSSALATSRGFRLSPTPSSSRNRGTPRGRSSRPSWPQHVHPTTESRSPCLSADPDPDLIPLLGRGVREYRFLGPASDGVVEVPGTQAAPWSPSKGARAEGLGSRISL